VDGGTTHIYWYPWQVALRRSGGFICGGTLISKYWVLTAGHCTSGVSASSLTVGLGCFNQYSCSQTLGVAENRVHPSYSGTTNDVATLRLSGQANMANRYINMACLPNGPTSRFSTRVVTTGWGRTSGTGSTSYSLKLARMKTFYTGCTDPRTICTADDLGYSNGGSVCFGDSGGFMGITRSSSSQWTVDGVTSWTLGSSCYGSFNGNRGVSGFASVWTFKNWIVQNSDL